MEQNFKFRSQKLYNPSAVAFRERMIAILAAEQVKDGSFLVCSSADPVHFTDQLTYTTIFANAFMLDALGDISEMKPITDRLAGFLLAEKSRYWTWNYWPRNSQEATLLPYPDDLDDTFCALAALTIWQPSLIGGETLAHVVDILTSLEEEPGGPYRTWLVADDSEHIWSDVDLVVNANIAYFLSQYDIRLPGLDRYLLHAVQTGRFSSPYYPGEFSVLYFLTRAAIPEARNLLTQAILVRADELLWWQTPLDSALMLSSLIRLGIPVADINDSIHRLIRAMDGTWPTSPLCIDPARDGKTYYNGSPLITACAVLETVTLMERNQGQPAYVNKDPFSVHTTTLEEEIKLDLSQLPRPLRTIGLSTVLTTVRKNPDIILLPQLLADAVGKPLDVVSEALLQTLARANGYGWVAYRIYDDLYDEIDSHTELLGLANALMRRVALIYDQAVPDTDLGIVARLVLDRMDAANTWEQRRARLEIVDGSLMCRSVPSRLPRQSFIDRSFGHALPAIAIVYAAKTPNYSQEISLVSHFFEVYIWVRQLHDDLHDWEEDIMRGRLTPVAHKLLQQFLASHPRMESVELLKALPEMRQLFWEQIAPHFCEHGRQSITRAKQMIGRSTIFRQSEGLIGLLEPFEQSFAHTLAEQREAANFFATYRSASD